MISARNGITDETSPEFLGYDVYCDVCGLLMADNDETLGGPVYIRLEDGGQLHVHNDCNTSDAESIRENATSYAVQPFLVVVDQDAVVPSGLET